MLQPCVGCRRHVDTRETRCPFCNQTIVATEPRSVSGSRMCRAALFAATNIAERSAKPGARELRRYLDITLGSLSEVSYLLRFSRDRRLLTLEDFQMLDDLRDQAGKLTWRVYSSLRQTRPP